MCRHSLLPGYDVAVNGTGADMVQLEKRRVQSRRCKQGVGKENTFLMKMVQELLDVRLATDRSHKLSDVVILFIHAT
eukprot:6472030-Amphidinium_carterae.2